MEKNWGYFSATTCTLLGLCFFVLAADFTFDCRSHYALFSQLFVLNRFFW